MTKGEVDIQVGNRENVNSLVEGTYVLIIPNCLLVQLENFYYVRAIYKNIIFRFLFRQLLFSYL